jgi:hypothetical protein
VGRSFRIIFLFVLIGYFPKAQSNDTAYHFIGLGTGYFADPDIAELRGEFNLNYAYYNSHLYFQLQTGLAPFTNFGNAFRVYPTIGMSSKPGKNFSGHFGIGWGIVRCSQSYNPDGFPIKYFGDSFIGNIGFLISPTKSNKIMFGLDASIGRYTILYPYIGPLSGGPDNGASVYLNFTVSYAIIRPHSTFFKYAKNGNL